jgi:hypothetical protein
LTLPPWEIAKSGRLSKKLVFYRIFQQAEGVQSQLPRDKMILRNGSTSNPKNRESCIL